MSKPSRKQPEHSDVRLPLVEELKTLGWDVDQLIYHPEWRVPKTPSEASKREEGRSFQGFPVDIAIFDEPVNARDYEHLLAIVETKSPTKSKGVNQLKIYLSLEPHARLGIWTNGKRRSLVYRTADGSFVTKDGGALPRPGDTLELASPSRITWPALQSTNARQLSNVFERLLDVVVARDNTSTRRDDQLNHLCNLLLVKLESDKQAKLDPASPVPFQVWDTEETTARRIQALFTNMKLTHTDLFSDDYDPSIRLDDHTIHAAAYELSRYKLLDLPLDVISRAFQVFRTASLKSEEGQYYTPYPVIRSAVKFIGVSPSDKIIDPACGTGGFLLEAYRNLRVGYPTMSDSDAKGWAQRHLYGIDKDRINVKLTKALMLIVGDGSTHTFLADSLRAHLWPKYYPALISEARDQSFTCVITNPPFGKKLRLSAQDGRLNNYQICLSPKERKQGNTSFVAGKFEERELGLVFLERCYRLLVPGGRLGIILPETYMFSPSYRWLHSWLAPRFALRGMLNIPMEAFQGFCRAKTNFYVFQKLPAEE